MKKHFNRIITFILIIIFTCSVCLMTACGNEARSIVSIEKYETNGLVDTYEIVYSDGTVSYFDITNGKNGLDGSDGLDGLDGADGLNGIDGEDGDDFSIDALFNRYKQEYPENTFNDFLSAYLTINTSGYSRVVSKLLLSSVKVCSEYTTGETDEKDISITSGSGVIYKITEDYTYILTNFHMVYSTKANSDTPNGYARKITCFLYGSNFSLVRGELKDSKGYSVIHYSEDAINATLIGCSATADLAIIRVSTNDVKRENPKAKAVSFASTYHVGETAIAIGNASDMGISVTQGVVSVENESVTLNVDGTQRNFRSIRLDAFITHGSSGGGLFNANGELIGITNAGNDALQGLNYAIPIQIVKAVSKNLEYYTNGSTIKGRKILLGVTVTAENMRYVYDDSTEYGDCVADVTVTLINENSISSKMGIQIGDILTSISINGESFTIIRNESLGDALYSVKAGDVIAFSGKRSGADLTGTNYTVLATDLLELA